MSIKQGDPFEQASAELDRVGARLAASRPNEGRRFTMQPAVRLPFNYQRERFPPMKSSAAS